MIYVALVFAVIYGLVLTLIFRAIREDFKILSNLNKDLTAELMKTQHERDVANRYYLDSLSKKPFLSDA